MKITSVAIRNNPCRSIECTVTMGDQNGVLYYSSFVAHKDTPHKMVVAKCVQNILFNTIDQIVDNYFKEPNHEST